MRFLAYKKCVGFCFISEQSLANAEAFGALTGCVVLDNAYNISPDVIYAIEKDLLNKKERGG